MLHLLASLLLAWVAISVCLALLALACQLLLGAFIVAGVLLRLLGEGLRALPSALWRGLLALPSALWRGLRLLGVLLLIVPLALLGVMPSQRGLRKF